MKSLTLGNASHTILHCATTQKTTHCIFALETWNLTRVLF